MATTVFFNVIRIHPGEKYESLEANLWPIRFAASTTLGWKEYYIKNYKLFLKHFFLLWTSVQVSFTQWNLENSIELIY